MKKNLIAIVEDQSFKITSVRDYQYAVVARANVGRYIALGDAYSKEQQANFARMAANGEKFGYFLDCWASRLDLAQKKAAALKNLVHDGISCYIDVQIVEVKPHYGVK